jgi:NADH-quinone oxidoreductase subunit E
MPIELSDSAILQIDELLTRYPVKQGALLPILHLVQGELGSLPLDAQEWIANKIEVSPATVYGVATFYPMYRMEPVGTYHLKVCATLSCALGGAEDLIEALKAKLGVDVGETTPDGKYTISRVECLAACGDGPVVEVNHKLYRHITADKVDEFLGQIEHDLG